MLPHLIATRNELAETVLIYNCRLVSMPDITTGVWR
jgi:hypothetical protein